MPESSNCQNCFAPYSGQGPCPHCGYDPAAAKKYDNVLPPFTVLYNRYLVGRVLGRGGFGITYVAMDLKYSRLVAIKEYMPSEYSSRSGGTNTVTPFADEKSRYVFEHGRERFVEEAKTLLALKNDPIVVDILKYFTENNTAYLVMEYLDGSDLKTMARKNGGKLDPDFTKMVFVTVASSLAGIHSRGILHRDISPDNIFYTKDGRIKLIDFGAARNYVSSQNKGLSILLKVGYAPPEQYNKLDDHGPWSDVYALCATFYHLVSGKAPIDALFRKRNMKQPTLLELGAPVSKTTSAVIEKGMALEVSDRYKSFMELLQDIDVPVPNSPPAHPPTDPTKPQPPTGQDVKNQPPSGDSPPQTPPGQTPQNQSPPAPPPAPVDPPKKMGLFERIARFFRRLFGGEIDEAEDSSGLPADSGSQMPPQPDQQLGGSGQANVPPAGGISQAGGFTQGEMTYGTRATDFGGASALYTGAYAPQPSGSGDAGTPAQPPADQNFKAKPYVGAVVSNRIQNKMLLGPGEVLNIGRSVNDCRFVISGDGNISRVHCTLRFDGQKIYLTDKSANGTYLMDNQRLVKGQEYEMVPGSFFYLATPNHMLVVDF